MQKYVKHIFLILIAVLAFAAPSNAQAANDDIKIIDIPQNHQSKNQIAALLELDILQVDPDFQFRPKSRITKGEAEQAINRALQISQSSKRYKEVKNLFQNREINTESNTMPITYKELTGELVQGYLIYTYNENLNVDFINNIIMSTNNEDNSQYVTRAEFASVLYNFLNEIHRIPETEKLLVNETNYSPSFQLSNDTVYFAKIPALVEEDIYLRAPEQLKLISEDSIDFGHATDHQFIYLVGTIGSKATVTIRTFNNGDYFVFTRFDNLTGYHQKIDLIQIEQNVQTNHLYRYDRYPIIRDDETVFGQDITSYPTGLLRITKEDGSIEEQMIGKAYKSVQLSMEYEDGGKSLMRNLLAESESLSFAQVGNSFLSINTLSSSGHDIVEHWVMNSDNALFKTDSHREEWMKETAEYYIKRNNWYTAEGPLNKMATSTEPLPKSGHGYGRNLLLVKEDRALALYKQQGDRYFENLVHNSFVNLDIFKGDRTYWQTEVTSTYLKGLYNITAPFIDTRFNEQIALFYYNSGELFNVKDYKEPLRNYADLLVSQKEQGHIIEVDEDSFYISDYFPIIQKVTTHSSMNHVLGGMNLLLLAYQEFGDEKYLVTARAIMTAIEKDQHKWIRDNGDIWYKISSDGTLVGDDYQHLTLEDLINAYKFWSKIDPTYLTTIEEMIASKSSYLSSETLGYTTKIYNGLKDIGMLQYLPKGEERTDAK
ncbi:S-layer homology domain-containing protein [Lysinibacillus telephonicus]|uniref:S-layer homology domain-containing protein n=1 Tax=Lysinibacillus telephonicus TaxID=1714840 RepID=A0A431UWZ8_9BACI|nr:S-layer homology domain-containing protein [Lysinibacillus telephonicus]RTQ96079.1 S-layer homology domain-containing protein [Lysinibacillus telephonicus]